jgi:hypothetical protein
VNASALLAKLEGVRASGRGWRTDCPLSHSTRGTLSVAEADDGRLLLHCFTGCSVSDILAALGMSVADLFPERITHHATPEQRKELRERAKQSQWRAALAMLADEAMIVQAAAAMVPPEILSPEDRARLTLAAVRIDSAREVLAA